MWLQSEECDPKQCRGDERYKDTQSLTFKETDLTQTIQYGIGKVIGHVVTDQVAWVPYPQSHQLTNDVRFLLIFEAENLNTLNQDGLVGLAPGSINKNQKPLTQVMYEQGQLRDNVFSMYLGQTLEQSKIWLGGHDRHTIRKMIARHQPEKEPDQMTNDEVDSEIKWLRLASKYYWMAQFEKAEIGGENWPISVNSLIFDSGSSVNHLPIKEYNILLNVITRDHSCRV